MRPLSLAMMARNAESTILRTLKNVESYVSEFVLTDNMSDDNTVAIAQAWASEIQKTRPFDFKVFPFNPETNPEAFITDNKNTFKEAPFADFVEYSDLPLLIDWSAMRNFAASKATLPYVLMLDADDVFVNPELIPSMVERMEKNRRDVLNTTYQIMKPGLAYPGCELMCWRIFEKKSLNYDQVHWIGTTHEHLTGYQRSCFAPDIIVKDMRDNTGAGARVSSRALKILWYEAHKKGLANVPARSLYYLGCESMKVDGGIAKAYLGLCLEKSLDPDELSTSNLMMCEVEETSQNYEAALAHVAAASKVLRTPDVCFTEGRINYLIANSGGDKGLLSKALASLEEGLALLPVVKRRLITRNPVLERGSYILLAEGYASLGMATESRKWASLGLEAFPTTKFLQNYAQGEWSL